MDPIELAIAAQKARIVANWGDPKSPKPEQQESSRPTMRDSIEAAERERQRLGLRELATLHRARDLLAENDVPHQWISAHPARQALLTAVARLLERIDELEAAQRKEVSYEIG